jgi:chromosome segregation ATPase
MARQGITQDQVYEAATALREEGTAPTVQAVRNRIGSGSFSTINRHLSEWREENAGQAVADIPDIPDTVQEAFRRIWVRASQSAQEGFDAQREALEAMRQEMERERASMAEEIERLEQALEESGEKAAQLEADLRAAQEDGQEKAGQITALSVENARLDERVKASDARSSELKGQLADLQDKFAEAVKAAQPRKTAKKTVKKKVAPARKPTT